jgi:hypothetical protein
VKPVSSFWGTVPAWISAGVAFLSAVSSAISAVRSRNSRKEAAQRAKDAADAALRSADAESRAAAAVEQLASAYQEHARIQAAERDAAAARPPWELRRHDQFNVTLHNTSDAPRFHVTANGEQIRVPGGVAWEHVNPRSAVEIHVLAGDDASPEIDVTWYDTEGRFGEPRRWRGLPT